MTVHRLFLYVVDRDFGFAPNPYHRFCTLATCKPILRRSACVGDWIGGMGGGRLNATGRCIFLMRVGDKITFQEYWADSKYRDKRPVRNGSRRMLVGDNIYHRNVENSSWIQEDSHHSNLDGTVNISNLNNDTQTDAVLVSDVFYYFGKSAPEIPIEILDHLGYKNCRNYRVFNIESCGKVFVDWIVRKFSHAKNLVYDDPFDFDNSHARYSAASNRISS